MRCRLRRTGAEQPLLPVEGSHVSHAGAAIGQHHSHVTDHAAGIMRPPALPCWRQRVRERAGEPCRSANSTSSATPACETNLAVRRDFSLFAGEP